MAYLGGVDALTEFDVEFVDVENHDLVVFNRLETLIDEWHEIERGLDFVGGGWLEKGQSQLLISVFGWWLLRTLGLQEIVILGPLVVLDILELYLL